MHSILRSVGILLCFIGIGSFVMPMFNRDHPIWQALGDARTVVMILSIVVGAGLVAYSYVMQGAYEREQADRRRTDRERTSRSPNGEARRSEPRRVEPPEQNEDSTPNFAAIGLETPKPRVETPPPRPPVEISLPDMSALEKDPEPILGGSAILVSKVLESPQVVGEYNPVAEEKEGSESVVIEKRDDDTAKRPTEKAPSSILQPMAEKKLRAKPAFEDDPESIFDELPQADPSSVK